MSLSDACFLSLSLALSRSIFLVLSFLSAAVVYYLRQGRRLVAEGEKREMDVWLIEIQVKSWCGDNILQHTATYCNILQHTATYCNILQHTATYCNILQHTATHCNSLLEMQVKSWCGDNCNSLQLTATHCNSLQLTATHCNSLLEQFIHTRATRCNLLLEIEVWLIEMQMKGCCENNLYVAKPTYCNILQYYNILQHTAR